MIRIGDLNIVSEDNNEIIAYCPFHDDKKRPNLLVSKTGRYSGYYKCFACGAFGQIDMGGKVRMSKLKDRPIALNWNSLNELYKQREQLYSMCIELSYKWDVSIKTLRELECGWNSEAWTFPVRRADLEIVGIQRIYPNGDKRMIRGSRIGVFVPTSIDWTKPLTITEGISDTAVASDMGLNVVGRLSCSCGNKILKELIKDTTVVIVSDNDKPGKLGAGKLATDLTKYNKVVIIYPEDNIGDLRLWVNKKGSGYVANVIKSYL